MIPFQFKKILIIIMLFLCKHLAAQTEYIDGYVLSEGKPIASVYIRLTLGTELLASSSTDHSGYFMIKIPDKRNLKEAHLESRHLAFKSAKIALIEGKTTYRFILEPKSTAIDSLVIKGSQRLRIKGDTMTFKADSFSRVEDRSIEDVLSRVPGMHIDETGKISFNGKEITALYIDGSNLLDEKYEFGSKTIPNKIIENIEVLQRHVHHKVLQDNTLSDDLALNLVTKDDAALKVNGRSTLGLGIPEQYDLELSAMLLNKKIKTLNSLHGNNLGKDLSSMFIGHTDFKRNSRIVDPLPKNLLRQETISSTTGHPYVNNTARSQFLASNNYFQISENGSLRLIAQQHLGRREPLIFSYNDNFASLDSIRFIEDPNNNPLLRGTVLAAQFEINNPNYFLSNNAYMEIDRRKESSELLGNSVELNHPYRHKLLQWSNHFQYSPKLKNGDIVDFQWTIEHKNSKERLLVEQLAGDPHITSNKEEIARQRLELPIFANLIRASYKFNRGTIKHTYLVGLLNERQKFNSELILAGTEYQFSELGLGAQLNDLDWHNNEFYFVPMLETKVKKWEFSVALPFIAQHIHYLDPTNDLDKSRDKVYFNPLLNSKFFLNAQDYLQLRFHHQRSIGNMANVFCKPILKTYRSLANNTIDLREKKKNELTLKYNVQRPLQLFFGNITAKYTSVRYPDLLATLVTDNLLSKIVVPGAHKSQEYGLILSATQYINALRGPLQLHASWTNLKDDMAVQRQATRLDQSAVLINPSFDLQVHKNFSVNYGVHYSWFKSEIVATHVPSDRITSSNLTNSIKLAYTPIKPLFVEYSFNHQHNKQGIFTHNHLFMDLFSRISLPKRKVDLEVELKNIANIKNYHHQVLTSDELYSTVYRLRGRMLNARCIFNF